MDEERIKIVIAVTFIIVWILIVAVFYYFINYRRQSINYATETDTRNKQHLHDLLTAKVDSQNQTMQHIGLEIHDNVGQKLTLASLYCKQVVKGSDLLERLNVIGSIIDESLTELRLLSKTLIRTDLATSSILSLLDEDAKQINASGLCQVSITSNDQEIALSQPQKIILLRLLQEFIQNSMKHSRCNNIVLSFKKSDDDLIISAFDDGIGFNVDANPKGIGLQNMKTRASQLNANFDLRSESSIGTKLTLQFTKQ